MTMKWKGTIEFAQCSEMIASLFHLLLLLRKDTKIAELGEKSKGRNREEKDTSF
mgnify:FL=1